MASNDNKMKSRKPIVKVIILEICLVLCALLQIVAMAFAIALFNWVYCTLFYSIFNNLSIITFAIIVILLYHPIFTDTTKVIADLNKNTTTGNDLNSTKHSSNSKHSLSSKKSNKVPSIHQSTTVEVNTMEEINTIVSNGERVNSPIIL